VADIDRLRELTGQLDPPALGDLVAVARTRRRRRAGLSGLFAVAAVVAAAVGALALTRGGNEQPQPVRPAITTTATPDAGTSTVPWEPPEPLRPPASRVARLDHDAYGDALPRHDPGDVAFAEIDIVTVSEGQQFLGGSSWRFQLAAVPPRDPAGRVITYGVVVDGDGDREADCQIGVNNDALARGDLHVWVTNLHTHETTVRDGPPYGMPAEFAHPAEQDSPPRAPEMQIGFLRGLRHPDPCRPFGTSSTFYAWSSLTQDGHVVATDFAPDAAWMPIRWGD
jgi:hypothetical protein